MKVNILRIGQLILLTVLIGGCASTEQELPETVSFVNGIYTIPESGVFINGEGDTNLELKPGEYRFLVKKPWHRDKIHTVLVERGQKQLLKLSPGQGFAEGKITVSPRNATLKIDDKEYSERFNGELDTGRYSLEVAAAGYFSKSLVLNVKTGQAFNVNVELEKIPTEGSLKLSTQPSSGTITFENKQSESPLTVSALGFGDYTAKAIKNLSDNERIVGQLDFSFVRSGESNFIIPMNSTEKLFEGQWYKQEKAIALAKVKYFSLKRQEELRYESQRVENPLNIVFEIGTETVFDKSNMTLEQFSKALFALLRVGDRLTIDINDDIYYIAKRSNQYTDGGEHFVEHFGGRVGASFQTQVESFWNQEGRRRFFSENRKDVEELKLSQGSSMITTLAYHLYRNRNESPIIDLDASMHSLKSIELPNHESEMTIVTIGGTDVRLGQNDISVTPLIGFHRVKASSGIQSISWSESPLKVLVVSEAGDLPAVTLNKSRLKVNEKSLVKLIEDGEVESIQRFTQLPNETWKYEVIEKSGPLASSLNLNVNEIGPHDVSGQYKRVWLIRYLDKKGNTQLRQLSSKYAVGEDVKETESDIFFRRSETN